MPRLILASASPRRRELLANAGFEFEVIPSEIQEPGYTVGAPATFAERVAQLKAETVARSFALTYKAIVLGADTVVVAAGSLLGKPRSPEEARATLEKLSGHAHEVITGVALVENGGRSAVAHEKTTVQFRALSHEEIEAYVASGEPLDKAGAYAIQGRASRFVTRIEGCYFNVMGLPVALVDKMLRQWKD
ncbi:MAG: Maf family protein [Acidobacteria bacterium]|nr:Maf family protein [Acidobacteriota bacterium]